MLSWIWMVMNVVCLFIVLDQHRMYNSKTSKYNLIITTPNIIHTDYRIMMLDNNQQQQQKSI